jgi:hypothetical protein
VADLRTALAAGWQDYRAYPIFGLFFGARYVVAGLLRSFVRFARGHYGWLGPAAAGFPLLAPFAAVGLSEVSRRREAGLPMKWSAVLGALRGHGDEQIVSIGVIVFVAFAFWLMIAHGIFAVFMAGAESSGAGLGIFLTGTGLAMLAFGSVVGASSWPARAAPSPAGSVVIAPPACPRGARPVRGRRRPAARAGAARARRGRRGARSACGECRGAVARPVDRERLASRPTGSIVRAGVQAIRRSRRGGGRVRR